ncbi:MAG TPA: PilZ domain-containing protein [Patescibacteria group bacterium]|nr:PilZ domain-containing protein [Patescibacteria group bacterium]
MAEQKRKFSRVSFPVTVHLEGAGITADGRAQDLGVKGMFVVTETHLLAGTPVALRLYVSGWREREPLCLKGDVVRVEPGGVAVEFREMSLETFSHLKNIVMYNNDGQIEEKTYSD